MKILHNFGRRKVVFYSVILMSFLLVQWQFYSIPQTKFIDQTAESIRSLGISNIELLGSHDNNSSSSFLNSNDTCIVMANSVPSTPLSAVDAQNSVPIILIKPKSELYQVIERFSAEDKLLRMNTTFKRILFWNEVGLNNIATFINMT